MKRLLIAILSAVALSFSSQAEDTSDVIFAGPVLDPAVIDELKLLIEPVAEKDLLHREKAKAHLCNFESSEPTPEPSWKSSLATVSSDIKADVLFEAEDDKRKDALKSFTLHIEFDGKRVLLRHSNARFPGDVAGVLIPFPKELPRDEYIEGQKGSDLFIVTPDTGRCATQAVLLCPRTFVPRYSLAITPYRITSVQYPADGSAEGIVALNPGEKGKSYARVQVTSTLSQPKKWIDETTGSSMTVGIKHKHDPAQTEESWTAERSAPPFSGAIKSSVEFQRPDGSVRFVSRGSSIDIVPYTLGPKRKLKRLGNVLDVAPGECWMVIRKEQ